jgi:hypothetical protein
MIDIIQLIIIFVIIVATGILLVTSVQIFLILQEFRKSLIKTNEILGLSGKIPDTVVKSVKVIKSLTKRPRFFRKTKKDRL